MNSSNVLWIFFPPKKLNATQGHRNMLRHQLTRLFLCLPRQPTKEKHLRQDVSSQTSEQVHNSPYGSTFTEAPLHVIHISQNNFIVINTSDTNQDFGPRLLWGLWGTSWSADILSWILTFIPKACFINGSVDTTLSGRWVLFTLGKPATFRISHCCAATTGLLSCATMQCHALMIMYAESTCPTDWACWQWLTSTGSSPPCNLYRTQQQS